MGYGAGFADFLKALPRPPTCPYLGAVARLDRCWTESHLAADAPALQAAWLAQPAAENPGAASPAAPPGCALAVVRGPPGLCLWQRQREGCRGTPILPWQGEARC